MPNIKKHLGEVVKNLRLESGLSQQQLAERCGLKRAYVGVIERGEKAITVEMALRLSKGLEVSLSAIFSRLEEIHNDRKNENGIEKNPRY